MVKIGASREAVTHLTGCEQEEEAILSLVQMNKLWLLFLEQFPNLQAQPIGHNQVLPRYGATVRNIAKNRDVPTLLAPQTARNRVQMSPLLQL